MRNRAEVSPLSLADAAQAMSARRSLASGARLEVEVPSGFAPVAPLDVGTVHAQTDATAPGLGRLTASGAP